MIRNRAGTIDDRWKYRLWVRTLAIGLTLLPVVAAGCSSDSDPIGLEPVCVEFRPDADPASGDVVAVDGAGSECDTAELELIVSGVDDVYGASFTIEYDSQAFQYVSAEVADFLGMDFDATEGSLLASDGASLLFEEPDEDPFDNMISIVVTRIGEPDGIDAEAGNDVLLRLRFIRLTSSVDGAIVFTNASLQASGDPNPVPIPDVTWFGGDLVVN